MSEITEPNGSNANSLAVVEIDELEISEPEDESIFLEHYRIKCISGLERFPNVKQLCLRNNLIKKIENLEPVSKNLEYFDVYDNQITVIENFDCLTKLTTLDLSFNRIKTIENLDALVHLKKLFLVNNRISHIQNLSALTQLEMLELGSNKIRKIENISDLVYLTNLFLGKNKITSLENLDTLSNLTLLSVQGNRITKIEGLDNLVNLEELYLSENGIDRIENLKTLTKLRILDLSCNFIEKIENLAQLSDCLEEFWLNDNKIGDWKEIDHLVCLNKLVVVYMERNPIYFVTVDRSQIDPNYRRKMIMALPKLQQLDANLTGVSSE